MRRTSAIAKIFCISFHKTGTTSVREYFRSIGVSCCHGPHIVEGIDYMAKVEPVDDDPRRIVDVLEPVIERFQAHGGVPYPGLYDVLAERYPDARFILMKRDLDKWWESIRSHWSLWLFNHRLTPFEYVQYRRYLGNGKRVISLDDREALIDAHRRHVDEVQACLGGRRLLVCNLEDRNKADKFAAFLGLSNVASYPHPKKTDFRRKGHRLIKNIKRRLGAA